MCTTCNHLTIFNHSLSTSRLCFFSAVWSSLTRGEASLGLPNSLLGSAVIEVPLYPPGRLIEGSCYLFHFVRLTTRIAVPWLPIGIHCHCSLCGLLDAKALLLAEKHSPTINYCSTSIFDCPRVHLGHGVDYCVGRHLAPRPSSAPVSVLLHLCRPLLQHEE